MSTWPGRVLRAVEEGVLFVTQGEWDQLKELVPEPMTFRGPGFEVRLNGLPVVVDEEHAQRQSEDVVRCLCVEVPILTMDGLSDDLMRSDRLCPIHGPDGAATQLAQSRARLAEDVRREALGRLKPDA